MAKGLDAQQQIFASNPDDRRAFEALEEHFFLAGDWVALVRVYRDRLAAPSIESDPVARGALLLRLGQILEERVVDLDAAAETYWQLARLDPKNRAALRQLRGIHARRGQWDMVLQLAEVEGATEMPPYERAEFETELGHVWRIHLGDVAEAERAYQRALELEADRPAALEGLVEIHLAAGDSVGAARLLERLTAKLRGPERAPFWLTLARIHANTTGDRPRARSCLRAALEDDPLLTAAVEWSLLLATEDEDWECVAGLLEHRFDLAAGARHRAAIAVEASQIHLHQCGSQAGARAWIERAQELAGDEGSVLYARADLERAEGNDAALAPLLERLVGRPGARPPRAMVVELASVHARRGEPAAALAVLAKSAPGEQNGDLAVLELRARCLRETGAKRELAEVLETLVAFDADQTAAARAARRRELARLCEDDLADAPAAAGHWAAAFALVPTDPEAFAALERSQRKQEEWASLRVTFETALAALGDDARRGSLECALGELLVDPLADPNAARAHFERALASPRDRARASAGLRRIAEATGDDALLIELCERSFAEDDDPAERIRAAQTAIDRLVGRGDDAAAHAWCIRLDACGPASRAALEQRAELAARLALGEDELATLDRLAGLLAGPERNRCLHRKAARLLEREAPELAVEALEQALASDPERIETLEALTSTYRRLARPSDEARCLRALGQRLPTAGRAAPLARLAELLEDPIGDLEGAIRVRFELIELPGSPADAARALERLLELAGRHGELASLLERERRAIGDETVEARALDLRRGKLLLDALGDSDGAAVLFASLHARDPEDEEVLDLLERALRAGHDSAGLCDLLARRASWEPRAIARAPIELERAQLLEEVLGQPEAACDVYESIVASVPDSAAALLSRARLESLCEVTGQWSRLQRLLVERVATLPANEQTPLRERIAEICRDRLQDPAGCAAQLERIAAAHPERVSVWQQLQDLYTRVLDRPDEWLRVAEAELASAPAPRRELALRVALGRLLLDVERRPAGARVQDAIVHYRRVFALDPGHAEAVEVLIRQAERERRPDEVAAVLEAHLLRLDGARAPERDALRLRLARVYADALGDDERARPLLETACAARGFLLEAAEPLAGIYERAGDADATRRLLSLARDAIRDLPNERARRPWRIRLASAAARQGELDEAAQSYRAVLVETPGDQAVEDALAEIYARQGEREPLIELLERRLAFAPAETELALHLRIAHLQAETTDEAPLALEHVERVLERVPHHHEALELGLALAARIDDPARSRRLLDRALGLPLGTEARADCLERRGLLPAQDADQAEQAIRDLREAVTLAPARAHLRHALRERLAAAERWPAVLECLALESTLASGPARIALYEEGAALAAERLGPDASLPWLARLRAERPDDASAWARLAAIHHAAGRFEAALRALDEQLARLTVPAERLAVERRRAALLELDLDSPGRAVLALQAALEQTDDRGAILQELDRLFTQLARPFERAAILEQRVAGLPGRAGIALRRTLAELYCVALAKPESALVHLQANVAATRDVPEEELDHLGQLGAALRACGREDEWAAVAERELALIALRPALRDHTPIDYQRFLREEIARILDRVLGDPERALEWLRPLCDDPIFAAAGPAPRIRERLHDLLRRTGQRTELCERLVRHAAAGGAEARDWLELANLHEVVHSDFAAALDAYREAERDESLRLEARRGRQRCAEALDDPALLAEALQDLLGHVPALPRAERKRIACSLGDLQLERRNAPEAARLAYQTALEIDPRDRDTLARCVDVCERLSDRAASIAYSRRELELIEADPTAPAQRHGVLLRLARHLAASEPDRHEAIAAYQEADRTGRLEPRDEQQLARLHERSGDLAAFRRVLGRWCDRDDSPASVADHLALAESWLEAEDWSEARARTERAIALVPEHAPAWGLLGRLERSTGRLAEARSAFERAASHALPIEAARHLVDAAACAVASDLAGAHALLVRAVRADATSRSAHAALARAASGLARPEEAVRHAEQALELGVGRDIPPAERLELALIGARAARSLALHAASIRLNAEALSIEPELDEALEGISRAHFASGDRRAARPFLERWLARPGGGAERASALAMLGCALEEAGELDAAAERQREALEHDAALDEAHEGLVRVAERAARPDLARAALERWAVCSREPTRRARAAVRAAEHALAAGDPIAARSQLDLATREDPEQGDAWVMLCDLAASQCGEDETRRLCESALARIVPGTHSARIALRLARLAEIAGDRTTATARYAEAWRWDARCSEAALCESRLARMAGDWLEADGILTRFLAAHPDPDSASLAQVHLERGRLLAGPLEACEAAITAYQRALVLQPGLAVARSALAGLLLHAPGRWRESLALHREILAAAPTTGASLRALVTLAERQQKSDVGGAALCVLAAVGLANESERASAPGSLGLALRAGSTLQSESSERLRRLAHALRDELPRILPEAPATEVSGDSRSGELPVAEIRALEDDLAAPGLGRLAPEERRSLFLAIAGLFLDPGGNGGDPRYRDPLDHALGIWTRRKVRRIVEETTLEAIAALDQTDFGHELRALAAAQHLDRDGASMRPALQALLALEGVPSPTGEADATPIAGLLASCEPARRLLARITNLLCDKLERGR